MKWEVSKKIKGIAGLVALCGFTAQAAFVTEGFEVGAEDPFTGTAQHTWVGDVGNFEITTATWPSGATSDFAGSNSLRHKAVVGQSTIVTAAGIFHNNGLQADWSVYFGGNSADIGGTKNVNYYLSVDSSSKGAIEAGTVNGYRLQLGNNGSDAMLFQVATGAGWSTLNSQTIDPANVNDGWNVQARNDGSGNWTWGFTNGTIGSPVTLGNAITDTAVTSGSYLGMGWLNASAGDNTDLGFDNFTFAQVDVAPEPSTLGLLGMGALLLGRTRKRRS